GLGLVAVADAELDHVQLVRQRVPCRQLVPPAEHVADELPYRGGVAGGALASGQARLVHVPGGLPPQIEALPIEPVELPDAGLTAGSPCFEHRALVGRWGG